MWISIGHATASSSLVHVSRHLGVAAQGTERDLLIAAGQNLKRFLAATGWGRRHAPCGSLVVLPREPWRRSVVFG
jgi:hypothetical protein